MTETARCHKRHASWCERGSCNSPYSIFYKSWRRPTLPATRGLCRPQPPLVFSAHPETPTAASTISQPRQTCRAAPMWAQVPWTTWGRFAHNSPRARVEVHLPCVLDRDAQSNAPLLRPRTGSRLSTTSTLIQPLYNRFPTPHQPSGTSTSPQPTFNRHATASQSHPRRNRSPITFQPPEADKRTIPRLANIHDSTTLRVEGKGDGEGRAFPES